MGFAMFNVFFFLTGALILQLLRLSGVHMDLVSFCFLLFNFSVSAHGSGFMSTLCTDTLMPNRVVDHDSLDTHNMHTTCGCIS